MSVTINFANDYA